MNILSSISLYIRNNSINNIYKINNNNSTILTQISHFSKYISKSRAKRLPLTTKRAGKGYYKGFGARKEGFLTSKAKFIRVPEKCTELVVPDLTNFPLKAYIGVGAKRHVVESVVKLK